MSTSKTQPAGSLDELVRLRIRSLISDKEMVTAQAQLDLIRSGEWSCDYTEWHCKIDAEIEKLLAQANAQAEPRREGGAE